ncbi:iron complex transport system substrate-binding protein [Actinopolyspora lacussalsi subsp. righensis]|uniref:Iron complex transport system substrate-binding protein n=1 Tax=Actinopolyspora righensis TaxID=995060 RepID=A0A1I7AN67_9ACTN|nr:ABC transporter substrate-binding protein [Actinopolyspora righensis]SFT76344.1 iron complex transport system substrate-binding protein [Actinopolyspora righensis]
MGKYRKSTVRSAALLFTSALLLGGCGAEVASESSGDVPERFPVTLTNCEREHTYETPPERVVTNDIAITEIMFALGLEDRMAGYFLSDGQRRGAASSPWKKQFEQVTHLSEEMGMEQIRKADADMVFAGWNYGFGESERLTPKRLRSEGIESYVLSESCRVDGTDKRGIMPPLEALYTDIRNLGELFGVPERAEKLVSEYKSTIERAGPDSAEEERPTVFLYDSGQSEPFTSGNGGAADQIINKAGGRNVFADLDDSWVSVSWETVLRADPDVILINDYGSKSVRDKTDFLRGHPALSQLEAVRRERFIDLPYAALVEGPRNPSAVRELAEFLESVPTSNG